MTLPPSPETKLISALVNNKEGNAASGMGITPDMFTAFRNEYEWLIKYQRGYGKTPSSAVLKEHFPKFPFTESDDIEYYVEELLEGHTKKLVVKTVREAFAQIREGDVQEAVLTVANFQTPAMRKKVSNCLGSFDILEEYADPPVRIKTPYKTINYATNGGYAPGEFWVVAARLGQGKSWTLQNMAADALKAGKKVLYYSLEMPTNQVMSRMNVIMGQRLGHNIKHNELEARKLPVTEYQKILKDIENRVDGELYLVDSSSGEITPETIRQQSIGMDVVFIDYLGLMTLPGREVLADWQQLGMISNQIKQIAISNNVAIIAAAQVNRTGDSGGRKPPDVVNLARADAIGQDADVVITHVLQSTTLMAYMIAKNRHGPSKVLFFGKFEPNTGVFTEVTADIAADIRDNEELDYA